MISDRFEWDDEKARKNPLKHDGVTFDEGANVFDDPFGVSREDNRQAYGEARFIQIGMSGNRLLVVAYTLRGERIRLISARKAQPRERRWYHDEGW